MPFTLHNPKKLSILIAEDNQVVSRTIAIGLEKLGHEVIGVAGNGREAVELVKKENPDLVIMDIGMPIIDGIEATKLILTKHHLPIIILTSQTDNNFVHQASKAGAAAFLIKPPNIDELERSIIIAFARHQDLEELRRVNKELEKSHTENQLLRELIPICTHCKRIRDDDKGYWRKLENFISTYSDWKLSHGVCPECRENFYSQIKIPNCWEFKNCGCEKSLKCPVVELDKGQECWTVEGTICGSQTPGLHATKLKSCTKCDFFQMLNYDVET